jgi:hypothetical protein
MEKEMPFSEMMDQQSGPVWGAQSLVSPAVYEGVGRAGLSASPSLAVSATRRLEKSVQDYFRLPRS